MTGANGEYQFRRRLLDTAAELRAMAQKAAPARKGLVLADARRLEALARDASDASVDPRFEPIGPLMPGARP